MDENFSAEFEEALSYLSSLIVRLRLQLPISFLLESHLPLAEVGRHLSLLVEPFASPFLGRRLFSALALILSDRRCINQLIKTLNNSVAKQPETP